MALAFNDIRGVGLSKLKMKGWAGVGAGGSQNGPGHKITQLGRGKEAEGPGTALRLLRARWLFYLERKKIVLSYPSALPVQKPTAAWYFPVT